MAVFKRKPGGHYWVRFRIGGKDIFRSARTDDREQAQEYEQALRNRYWRQVQLGEQIHTWGEAVTRLKRESTWSANTEAANDRSFARFAKIAHIPLADIDRGAVGAARSMLIEDGLAPASVNRHMAVFRQVLRAAVNWGWLKDAPPVAMASVPERDADTLTGDTFATLLRELPEHLRGPALLAVTTGLRMANVRDLTWGQVHLPEGNITIAASSSKSRKALTVPLTPMSAGLLASIPRTPGTDRVFTYRPFLPGGEGARGPAVPIAGTLNAKAFRKARERAGITSRWHDLRHTFASWAALAGTPDRVLQALGGWSSPAMLTRYAHLSAGDTRSWASLAGANAVAGIVAVMPEVMQKVQQFQDFGVCRLTESNCGPHHYEVSNLPPQSRNINGLETDSPVDRSQNESSGTTDGAKVVALFPGRKS